MRRISIFGVTGSVGQITADIISQNLDGFDVIALSGGKNIKCLAEMAKRLKANIAVTSEVDLLNVLQDHLKGTNIQAMAGREALLEAASCPVDWAMSAVVGFAGVKISLALAQNSQILALANKESMVCAGELLQEICQRYATTLLPVDSEHSAIFQLLQGEKRSEIERVILTASGGPFLHATHDEMARATPEEAMQHPRWSMGQRISIDSASMFNKAMELIETKELFGFEVEQLEIIVHPQSIIHSMIGFQDGALLAHMGPPDMRGAVGYALHWPNRRDVGLKRLDFSKLSRLDFIKADQARFPALRIAQDVISLGGLAGTVFNAAKEQALDLFLEQKIGFLEMAGCVDRAVQSFAVLDNKAADTMDKITKADTWARNHVLEQLNLKRVKESV